VVLQVEAVPLQIELMVLQVVPSYARLSTYWSARATASAAEDNEWIFIQTSLYENQEKRLTSQPAYSLYKNIMIPLFIFLLQRYYVFAHYTIPIFRYFGGFLS